MKWIALALVVLLLTSKTVRKILKKLIGVVVVAVFIYLAFTAVNNKIDKEFEGAELTRKEAFDSLKKQALDKEAWKVGFDNVRNYLDTCEMGVHVKKNFDRFISGE